MASPTCSINVERLLFSALGHQIMYLYFYANYRAFVRYRRTELKHRPLAKVAWWRQNKCHWQAGIASSEGILPCFCRWGRLVVACRLLNIELYNRLLIQCVGAANSGTLTTFLWRSLLDWSCGLVAHSTGMVCPSKEKAIVQINYIIYEYLRGTRYCVQSNTSIFFSFENVISITSLIVVTSAIVLIGATLKKPCSWDTKRMW